MFLRTDSILVLNIINGVLVFILSASTAAHVPHYLYRASFSLQCHIFRNHNNMLLKNDLYLKGLLL